MNFKNWDNAKGRAEELNLYTKSYLKEKYNRKPSKEAIPSTHQVYTGGKWKCFDFYGMEDTIEIKNRVKKEIVALEINSENISKALYVINKSAKKSRDTKVNAYDEGNYGVVSSSKTRQNKLYDKKDLVIKKAEKLGYIKLIGYNTQDKYNSKLLLYKGFGEYKFHVLVDSVEPSLEFIGDIEEQISSEVKINTEVTFTQAVELLDRFLENLA